MLRSICILLLSAAVLTYTAEPALSQDFLRHGQRVNGRGLHQITPYDYDADGDLDLLSYPLSYGFGFIHYYGGDACWLENQGDGRFVSHSVIALDSMANGAFKSQYPVDVDNDGDTDILQSWIYRRERIDGVYHNFTTLNWWENTGDLAYERHSLPEEPIDLTTGPGGLYPGDLDGDGDIDVITDLSNGFLWLEFEDGAVSEHRIESENTREMKLLDYDGDSDLDLIEFTSANVSLWINDGAANFQSEVLFEHDDAQEIESYGVQIDDLDSDGDLDIWQFLPVPPQERGLRWWENHGDQGFEEQLVQMEIPNIMSEQNDNTDLYGAKAVDFDGDDDLDFIAAVRYWDWDFGAQDGRIEWWENDGAMNYERHVVSEPELDIFNIVTSDFDGDGRLDIATSRVMDGNLIWWSRPRGELFLLPLRTGWQYISSPVDPVNPLISVVFRDAFLGRRVVMLKDQFGHFWRGPDRQWGLNEWIATEGFAINMCEPDTLVFEGEMVADDHPVPLNAGWNLSAYFPAQETNPQDAFANIEEHLIFVKDDLGRFYAPRLNGFSNMALLHRGGAYQIRVDQALELVWNTGDRNAARPQTEIPPAHFIPPTPTGSSMSLLLTLPKGLLEGEIGAFDQSGICVGAARLNGCERIGMAIWGDNPTTETLEGCLEGCAVSFKLWNNSTTESLEFTDGGASLKYQTDGFEAKKVRLSWVVPTSFDALIAAPNPSNGQFALKFSLPEAGSTRLAIYDLSGCLIVDLTSGALEAGVHRFNWDASSVASGIYIARLTTSSGDHVTKLALVK